MEYKKICKNPDCRKPFTTHYPQQVHCSSRCKYLMDVERQKKKYAESDDRYSICKVCGKKFIKSVSFRAFCSQECRDEVKKNSSNLSERECECCHKIFKTAIEDKLFCSARCRKIGKKKKIMSIEDVARAAREEGITYGEYVTKHNL